jgi:hypothetical protein
MLHPLYVVEIAGMTKLIDVLLRHRVGVFKIHSHNVGITWFANEKISLVTKY